MSDKNRKIAGILLFIIGVGFYIYVLVKPSGTFRNLPLIALLALGAISIIAGFAVGDFGTKKCSKNSDCGEAYYCMDGICVHDNAWY